MPAPFPELAPIVTFYSYKGGVGRSMAVLNVSSLLAARGFRVLVIDFDLEAPGLSHLLEEVGGKKAQSRPCSGVVELLADAKQCGEQSDLFAKPFAKYAKQYTFHYPIPPELKAHKDGRLFIMPAGRTDPGYALRLNDLNLAALYQEGVGLCLMTHFKQVIKESTLYDFIIVDSRTGHSDEAGICTRDLADQLMVVTGFNRQNISGTASFLTNLRAAFNASGIEPKNPVIILSPVPIGEEDMLAKREDDAKKKFSEAWGKPLPLDLFIPYHPRLAHTEDAYVSARTASDLRDAYNKIESRLLEALNHFPGSLLAKAKDLIMSGEGAQAVAFLEKYAKLETSTGKGISHLQKFPFGWNMDFDLEENDELIKRVLALPEADKILEIYVETKSSASDLFLLAKKLHELESPQRISFDKMILKSKRLNPDHLGSYAIFLHSNQKDDKAAEVFYKLAINADPINANHLGNYAVLLSENLKDDKAAEVFYKRAIKADPKNTTHLENYANFLKNNLKDDKAAEVFYKRAIDADPKHATHLGSYGQILVGRGAIADGIHHLRSAWQNMSTKTGGNAAEFAYSLWLGTMLLDSAEVAWEQAFKFLITAGFRRHRWNFDAMLAQARTRLKPADFKYAKALADAFLDESKVPALNAFPRWKKLQPLDPARINANGAPDKAPQPPW